MQNRSLKIATPNGTGGLGTTGEHQGILACGWDSTNPQNLRHSAEFKIRQQSLQPLFGLADVEIVPEPFEARDIGDARLVGPRIVRGIP